MNYTGERCMVCSEKFKDSDDIVVCPVCGTPYHRACYEKSGECVNHELHESGLSWNSAHSHAAEDGNTVKCPRCGAENPDTGIFCNSCGMPLRQDEARPFNESPNNSPLEDGSDLHQNAGPGMFETVQNAMRVDENTEIEGIKVRDYADYVGSSEFYFIRQFLAIGKYGARVTLNIPALFFPQFYLFYRKQHALGILVFLISAFALVPQILSMLSDPDTLQSLFGMDMQAKSFAFLNTDLFYGINLVSSLLSSVMSVLCALRFNKWYYDRTKTEIKDVQAHTDNPVQKRMALIARGGTSMMGLVLSVSLMLMFTLAIMVFYFKI